MTPPVQKKQKLDNATNLDWFNAIEKWIALGYDENSTLMRKTVFLGSEISGPNIRNCKNHRNLFPKKLKQFKEGRLEQTNAIRQRQRKYIEIEKKLVNYIHARRRSYTQDKCGLSWIRMKTKCLQWAQKYEGMDDFSCSNNWIHKVLVRNCLMKVNLHGEGNEMTPEREAEVMTPWLSNFHEFLSSKGITSECLYNADQSGLYYQKLPNTLYVSKEEKKKIRGTKQMKDKQRITLMICTSASGSKLPICVVGKSEMPKCFKDNHVPLPYTNQTNAWFDRNVTRWWIQNVLLRFHDKTHGRGTPCCILLDNCSAHKLTDQEFERLEGRNVFVKFFPPNVTSKRQPADMGIIASIKVGYKVLMLNQLLDLFDEDGGYELAVERRKKQKPGCKGLAFGGKATVLDAIKILDSIWRKDSTYAKKDGIRRCWRKADILPSSWNADINNDVGSASLPECDKKLSEEDCSVLCNLMKSIQLKAKVEKLDTSRSGANCFENSFVCDPDAIYMPPTSWIDMATNWIDIEEDPDIIEDEIEEVIDELEVIDLNENLTDNNESMNNDTVSQKVTKRVALDCIDKLKDYCEQNKMNKDSVNKIQSFEKDLMKMRFERSNVQKSIMSYTNETEH